MRVFLVYTKYLLYNLLIFYHQNNYIVKKEKEMSKKVDEIIFI